MKSYFGLLLFALSLSQAYSQTRFLVSSESAFNDAVNQVQPGDEIVLRNGTWQNVTLVFDVDGALEDSITLTAQTPGKVILTGTSKLEIAGDYLIVKNLDFNAGSSSGDAIVSFRRSSSDVANHSRLTNCRILNYNPASDAIAYKWVSIYGEHNRVDHCHFEGKNNEGALLVVWLSGSANFHRIDHNYFANIPELGRNGGETIRIGTSTNSMTVSRTTVEYNLFESCDGETEIISNKSGFNMYRYNTFRDNEGTLTLRHGNDCEVYGNFFFGGNKRSGGVRIIGERHKVYNNYFEGLQGDGFRAALCMTNGVPNSPLNRYFQVIGAEVVNNTFIACKEPIAIGEGKSDELSLPPKNNTIANNVIDQTTGSKAITYTDTPMNMQYLSNYINGNIGIEDNGNINEDPLMEEKDGLYRPSSESPLLDNSTGDFEYITLDIDGQSRDANPDIGCDEKSTTVVINRPLVAGDVGYDWTYDPTQVILSAKELNGDLRLISSNGEIIIHGLNQNQLPLRLMLFNLSGQLMFNALSNSDTVNVGMEGVFVSFLINDLNQILYEEKIIMK